MRQPSSKGASTQQPQITSLSYAAERDKKKLGDLVPFATNENVGWLELHGFCGR